MTLHFSNYLEPYPHVSVQVANLGGTMPFLWERIEEVAFERSAAVPATMRPVSCYVDTASFGPRAIVLLGTDCPIFNTDRLLKSVSDARLDAETRERILFRNARQLFSIS